MIIDFRSKNANTNLKHGSTDVFILQLKKKKLTFTDVVRD